VDRSRVVFHGRSLGGGAICALARHHTPAALVLQSTFTSVPDVAKRWFVPRFLIADVFDNAEVVGSLRVPILITHGRRDAVVPVEHAHGLMKAAHGARLHIYDSGHNEWPPDPDFFWEHVGDFLVESGVL
jgi:fermentation-respiration switch protein FrsA (DUF1100 family)